VPAARSLRAFHLVSGLVPSLLVAQGLPTGSAESLGFTRDGLARVAAVVQAHVDSGLIAGAAFVVARNGKVAWQGTAGVMDLGSRTPMRPDAIFRICSMTKPVTAVAAMQLVERGRIALDDPVAKYLPAFAGVKVYAGGPSTNPVLRDPARPIQVADLLLHTAGFGPRYPSRNEPIDSLWASCS
jgi:CubicO group peptidase (beta-lactamase class C family)